MDSLVVSLSKFTSPLKPFGVHLLLAPSGVHPLLASPNQSLVCLGDGLTGGVPQQVHISLEPLGLQASHDLWREREGQDCY